MLCSCEETATPHKMPRRRRRAMLCLAGLTYIPVLGGGFSPQAFMSTAAVHAQRRVPDRQLAEASAAAETRAHPRAARPGSEAPGSNPRKPQSASTGVFGSVARTPIPPAYEGGRQQRQEEGDEAEFNRNVGKVIDTLRRDYPNIFQESLDFDIYTPDLQLRDPSGVVLTGLSAYQRLFATLRFVAQVMVSDVSTVIRLSYDGSRQQVRVCWHFVFDCSPVVVRPMHVDGISVYSLSVKGLVRRHDLETIVVNGKPATPPFAQAWIHLPSWLSKGAGAVGGAAAPGLSSWIQGVPSGAGTLTRVMKDGWRSASGPSMLLPSLAGAPPDPWRLHNPTVEVQARAAEWPAGVWTGGVSRASSDGLGSDRSEPTGGESGNSAESPTSHVDEGGKGVEEGNDRRKSDEEKGDDDGKQKKNKRKKKKGFWPIELDGPLGCETSWDCTGGYVCCDLVLVKICCTNGIMQPKPGDLIPLLRPIPGRGRTELDQLSTAS